MKAYIFAIGGTGSRVLRSLIMLLATGLKLDEEIESIVPIIIDPDISNGDLSRTKKLLSNYQKIHQNLQQKNSPFFTLDIKVSDSVKFKLDGTSNKRFKDYIGYSELDEENKALIKLLFSDKNLESNMNVGFKGNPNIGSVVLNQFDQSDEFDSFTRKFNKEDKIFIISSIFGGTGAAGFPLLLKTLRSLDRDKESAQDIKDAVIGAITYLPYFKVADNKRANSEIDSATFMSKSKAALSYYDRAINATNSINALYYIGDTQTGIYDNYDGQQEQKNLAHFLEMAGALAIVNFLNDKKLKTKNGKAISPKYCEYGTLNESIITINELGDKSKDVFKRVSNFHLVQHYLKNEISNAIAKKTPFTRHIEQVLISDFFTELKEFINEYNCWIEDMANNTVSFQPFNFSLTSQNALQFINHKSAKDTRGIRSFLFKDKHSIDQFDELLNKKSKNMKDTNADFLNILHLAATEIITKKYNF